MASLKLKKLLAEETEILWAKFGKISSISFMSKDYICAGIGHQLMIYNLVKDHTNIFKSQLIGAEGINAVVGHHKQLYFAFAELAANPSVFIVQYPEFKKINYFPDDAVEGYNQLRFTLGSVLLATSNLPFFQLIVWNWRTGERLAKKQTDVFDSFQRIRCGDTPQMYYLAQLGITTGQLKIWDIFPCVKKCVVTQHSVKMPPDQPNLKIVCTAWIPDGELLVGDNYGCIHLVNSENMLQKIIDLPAEGPLQIDIAWYANGVMIKGPDYCLRHFRKMSTSWDLFWKEPFSKEDPISLLTSGKSDYLVCLTEKKNIIKLQLEDRKLKFLNNKDNEIDTFCLIYPCGEYIAVLCHNNWLYVYEIVSGTMVSELSLNATALDMAENPELPYVGICYENGVLELYSLCDPNEINLLAHFFLTRNELNSICFSTTGRVFATGNLKTGEFFILEGIPGGKVRVVTQIWINQQIADYMVVPSKNCFRFFAIPVTSKKHIAGNKIIRYCTIPGQVTNVKEYTIGDGNHLYYQIHATPYLDRDKVFYALPLEEKFIHKLEVRRGDNYAYVLTRIPTGHLLKKMRLKIDLYHAITWSHDGFVFVRDCTFSEFFGSSLTHHRRNYGVQKAVVDPTGKYVIALGKSNLLSCTSLLYVNDDSKKSSKLLHSSNLKHFKKISESKKMTPVIYIPDKSGKKTWCEVEEEAKMERERIRCSKKRESILKEFKTISLAIQMLLTTNLAGPDNEKLDQLEFNLDKELYEIKLKENEGICLRTEIHLRNLLGAQSKVTEYLMEEFWKTMKAPGVSIFGIFANLYVPNFVLLPLKVAIQQKYDYVCEKTDFYFTVVKGRPFIPWIVINEEELEKMNEVLSTETSILQTSRESAENYLVQLLKQHDFDSNLALEGSQTSTFIKVHRSKLTNMIMCTYAQYSSQVVITYDQIRRLQEYFNEEFDNVMQQKVKGMNTILEKNARLRHIISEINYFSDTKLYLNIDDPEWRQEETPAKLIKVEINEISITPYISPSEQARLNAEADEAERIRLLLLADDFRERALMAMMNGVLEVRWEDELKKEIPIPKCMLDKDPTTFNEEDLKNIKDYEEKVKNLSNEREKYKHLLKHEYRKVSNSVKLEVKQFNNRLGDLLLLKLKVQTAIDQESMRLHNGRLRLLNRKRSEEKETEMRQTIASTDEVIHSLQSTINFLQSTMQEFRGQFDNLLNREKILDKNLRKDLLEISSAAQETCIKLYKKRPKINIKSITSKTLLEELAKCIATQEKSFSLNTECLEFLKAIDQMDQYINIPPTVDERGYTILCKHRRLRMEYEVKVRLAQVTITEGETTLSIFRKRLTNKRDLQIKNIALLERIRMDRLEYDKNIDSQLMLKSGLVEITLNGEASDFDEAVLIKRSDVEMVNALIQVAGKNKIKALRQSLNLSRRVAAMEWDHKKLKMHIRDLEQQIEDINETNVTREMRNYLKSKQSGKSENVPSFETEVDIMKQSFEDDIAKLKEQYNKLKRQINGMQESNEKLDNKIANINVDVCEHNLEKDHAFETDEKKFIKLKTTNLMKRTKLMQQIQVNHNEILVLQTELELLRLKTYPTLKYKIVA